MDITVYATILAILFAMYWWWSKRSKSSTNRRSPPPPRRIKEATKRCAPDLLVFLSKSSLLKYANGFAKRGITSMAQLVSHENLSKNELRGMGIQDKDLERAFHLLHATMNGSASDIDKYIHGRPAVTKLDARQPVNFRSPSIASIEFEGVPHLEGYLEKRAESHSFVGWQKRWFETEGAFLRYYKSERKKKILAAIDLRQVYSIGISEDPKKDREVSLEVENRLYRLKARRSEEAKRWIEGLSARQLVLWGIDDNAPKPRAQVDQFRAEAKQFLEEKRNWATPMPDIKADPSDPKSEGVLQSLRQQNPNLLFVIARSLNLNLIAYEAWMDHDGKTLLPNKPVEGYWLSIDPKSVEKHRKEGRMEDRSKLKFIDNKFAYGVSFESIDGTNPVEYSCSLVAFPSRKIRLFVDSQGIPRAEMTIDNTTAYLQRIFVQVIKKWPMPKPLHVELYGVTPAGAPVFEKVMAK